MSVSGVAAAYQPPHLVNLAPEGVARDAALERVSSLASLILDPVAASTLKELLTDEPALPLELDASSREVLTEVGNIVLNACIGTFGNLLRVPVSFSVPDIDVSSLRTVVNRMSAAGDAMRYALVVTAGFRLREAEVTGYVVIVLTVQSLTRLLIAVEEWVGRQEQQ